MSDDETWVDADHANTLNAFDVGDTRTTHAIVEQASTLQAQHGRGFACNSEMAAGGQLMVQTFPIDDARELEKHQNGTGIGDCDAPAYTLDRQQRPGVVQTFSVYQEGGNGADLAASEVERSPSLTKVKSERGVHVTHTLTSAGHDASEDGTGRGTPIVAHPASGFSSGQSADARSLGYEEGLSPTLRAGQGGNSIPKMHQHMSVRRLTPLECERLMGWPETPCNDKCGCGESHGWTAPAGVKAPDSKRYAACGDGIVAPVAFWIADRIRMIEDEEEK